MLEKIEQLIKKKGKHGVYFEHRVQQGFVAWYHNDIIIVGKKIYNKNGIKIKTEVIADFINEDDFNVLFCLLLKEEVIFK